VTRSRPYVLVVDDSPDGREMLHEYLTFRGLNVVAVASGEAALTQAFQAPPALILMDLQMPGITGWEATRQLKAHPDTKDVIVIALSAHALAPDERIAREAGCDQHGGRILEDILPSQAAVTATYRIRLPHI